jgi:hypothetical protein
MTPRAALRPLVLCAALLLTACGDDGKHVEDAFAGLASADQDGDGWGADEDCDERDGLVHPGALEACDGVDNDCDGQIDEEVEQLFYLDADGDGFGGGAPQPACALRAGLAATDSDCDDRDPAAFPGATEVCDGDDDDCDGEVDEGALAVYYTDGDGDGYGDARAAVAACAPGPDEVAVAGDCDDAAPLVSPGAPELCNAIDDDCDGVVDEDDATDAPTWYRDTDGDGFGGAASSLRSCIAPFGYAATGDDCDDLRAESSPVGVEVCNLYDDDCDGDVDEWAWGEDFSGTPAGLQINGSASLVDGALRLTPSSGGVGTALWADPIPGARFRVRFSFWIGGTGGGGGDGLAFLFLDSEDPTLLGAGSSQLGYGGLPGYAAEADTYGNSGWDPSGNHVALMDTDSLRRFSGNADIPELEDSGWHTMEVEHIAPDVRVWLDGALVLDDNIYGYPSERFLVGFSGATGTRRNEHRVDDVWFDCP